VLGVIHLVDEECHVVFAVDIASFAVLMSGFFDLVLDHGFMGLEMSVAIFVAALDLARHRCLSQTLNRLLWAGYQLVGKMGRKRPNRSDQ
jgi:hypothetical protein